jgi:hypothetical protein
MHGSGEEGLQRLNAWLMAVQAATRNEVSLSTDPVWDDWAIERGRVSSHCSCCANWISVLNQYAVSVTCEVSKDGRSRWFLTKESGRRPGCCGSDCAGYEGRACVDAASAFPQAYAVLKMESLIPPHYEFSGSSTLFQRLTVAGLEALARVASSASTYASANWGDGSASLRFWRYGLPKGMLAAGKLCLCNEQVNSRCIPCLLVQRRGGDSRWCVMNRYKHFRSELDVFPWFNGRSDAVGDVIASGGCTVRWLSCPLTRTLSGARQ